MTAQYTATGPASIAGILSLDQLQLSVETSDLTLSGLYEITIDAQAGGLLDQTQKFNLRLQPPINGCEADEITIDRVTPLTVYYISEPALSIPMSVTQTASENCPL